MTFGQKLTEIRRAAGLSQEQLASLLDMSRQAVSKWETGESVPDVEKLAKLCGIFNVSADELLGLERKPPAGDKAPDAAPESGLRDASRSNLRRRVFSSGWIMALVSVIMLVLEYMFLYYIKYTDVMTNTGFYQDVRHYAGMEPMTTVFSITTWALVIGIIMAVLALGWPHWCRLAAGVREFIRKRMDRKVD